MQPSLPLYFKSDRCPNFATAGNEARPIKADTQTGRILQALCAGMRLTTADARRISHSENAKARISEVRVWLKAHGIELKQGWVAGDTARYLEHWLEPLDQVVAYERMKQKS